jgi:anti-sigma regulatory factor (Ser/Thr protein kinase)
MTQIVEVALPAHTHAPADARALLRDALHTWELDGLGDVTEIIVTELVANVVRHVGTTMTLRISATADRSMVRIEVDDPSSRDPEVQHPKHGSDGGRGLMIVDALSTRWGVHHRESGKTVWAEIDAVTAAVEMHAEP